MVSEISPLHDKYINLEYLKLMCEGDADMERVILDLVIDEIPAELSKMTDALAGKDWHGLFEIAHKFKTTLSYVGNAEMTNITKTLEFCARGQTSLEEIPGLIASLEQISKEVLPELKMKV